MGSSPSLYTWSYTRPFSKPAYNIYPPDPTLKCKGECTKRPGRNQHAMIECGLRIDSGGFARYRGTNSTSGQISTIEQTRARRRSKHAAESGARPEKNAVRPSETSLHSVFSDCL